MKRRFTDEEVVDLLLSNDLRQHDQALIYLYEALESVVIRLIERQGGSREDGEEMLSSALYGLFTNVRAGRFQLQASVKLATYVCTLAKYNWLNQVRKAKPWLGNTVSLADEWIVNLPQDESTSDEHQELFQELISRLGTKCRALLEAFVEGFSMQEIAQMLSLGTADNAKAHKYNCLKKLDALRTKHS
ncbi:RNA polymerase sigma factor [Spirosoma sordidisoli]|uniref:Sigma-70 family RNA polymerase sigma factor n=1 Tax=Spirosoma sordidisoli TaxID=2502893 RepID=A0A4Q2UKJ3_9BACT|nr:sigma-70 family RNA polymerase sigma factor [Spirosoma sordidisoli]RYC70047.1 sigma-70 family RNA polymerase sigma factor [Spirosoma sordidisoli]